MLLTKNGYFNLHNIIFHSVDDIFIDAHFVGKSVEYQIMLFGIIKYFLIPFRNPIPTSFMESPQILSVRGVMKPGLIRKERDFNKKFGLIVIVALLQAGNGNHRTVGSFMKPAEMVFLRLGRNQFHLLFKGGILAYIHGDQAPHLLFNDADFG